MGKILKQIGRGVLKGAKDLLPIPTKEVTEGTAIESVNLNSIAEQKALIISELLTSRGGMIALVIYLLDQIFQTGIFNF